MAISEDLRSVRLALGDLVTENEALIALLRDNLESLAEQVEALEDLPFAPFASLEACDRAEPPSSSLAFDGELWPDERAADHAGARMQ